jgi:AcrR family transcriptional regulator
MSTESGIGKRRQAARDEGGAEYRARREELVRVAATVFQEKGYQASTLNDIAEQLGTDRASLYYYVSSKEDLFQEVVRGVLDANVKEANRIVKLDEPAAEKLNQLIRCLMLSYESNYPFTYVYIQEDMGRVTNVDTEWAKGMSRQTRRFESIVKEVLRDGIAARELRGDLSVDVATNALFGMLNWTHRWFKPGRGTSGEEVAATFSQIFLDGVAVR